MKIQWETAVEADRDNRRGTTGTAREQEWKAEGDEPDPRHWWKTAVAASFPTWPGWPRHHARRPVTVNCITERDAAHPGVDEIRMANARDNPATYPLRSVFSPTNAAYRPPATDSKVS